MDIAVLITCHNRREKTLTCLESLFKCSIPDNYQFDVFLVDDGSTDGTGEAVRQNFPEVKVIHGDGNLFWNGGMRLAWKTAAETKDYDFYLWLNDDTTLNKKAVVELLTCYEEGKKETGTHAIITGACKSENEYRFTYGGRTDDGPVIPNGAIQQCTYINGNAVLVSKEIFNFLGYLSSDYTHAMGDFDYGLRALKHGFKCITTKKYIALCQENSIPAWCNPDTPLFKRLKLLHSPKGLNLSEYNTFRKKFWGWKWVVYAGKAYLKVLWPYLYQKMPPTRMS